MNKPKTRCVNIDWLEVYCLESRDRFPCNADYYREHGYFVREREYGTRVYKEMFEIEDEHGEPWLEIRRNPASADSSFSGLVPQSTHIRLKNRSCYFDRPVEKLRDFLIANDYIFQRIYRIDVCYDFILFDDGSRPDKFCQRYLAHKFTKINQCKVATHGEDNWSAFAWESISWGSRKSMVTTKIYDKSKELRASGNDKPYIRFSWFEAGLIDDPIGGGVRNDKGLLEYPDIWRIEFSMTSAARNWLVIEDQSGKKVRKKAVPHTLSLFDGRDRLWQRFEDLAYHYFRFKHYEEGKRKDRCKDRILFYFSRDRNFYHVEALPPASRKNNDDEILRRRLTQYRLIHADADVRQACDVLLKNLNREELRRLTHLQTSREIEVLRLVIAQRCNFKDEKLEETVARVTNLLLNDDVEVW